MPDVHEVMETSVEL